MVGFALMYVVFDEEEGPVLKKIVLNDLSFPTIILRGATTTLFTMAVGVGEPEGDHETAIIPVSITNARGRVLIYSFGLIDASFRGGKRIESFMLFIEHSFQDIFLQRGATINNVLKKAANRIETYDDYEEVFNEAFSSIRRVVHTEIDTKIQSKLSNICSDTEIATVSDGKIKAIVNAEINPALTDNLSVLHQQLDQIKILRDELQRRISIDTSLKETYGSHVPSFSSALEIHGKAEGGVIIYGLYKNGRLCTMFSRKRGIIGRLMKPMREIADLVTDHIPNNVILEEYIESDLNLKNEVEFLTDKDNNMGSNEEINNQYKKVLEYEKKFTNLQLFSISNKELHYSKAKKNHTLIRNLYLIYLGFFRHFSDYAKHLSNFNVQEIIIVDPSVTNTIIYPLSSNDQKKVNKYIIGDSKRNIGYLRILENEINKVI